MSRDPAKEQTGSLYIVSIVVGLISGLAILVALNAVGLPGMEAGVFAVLSGFTTGAFVYRERSLTRSNDISLLEHRAVVTRLEKHIQFYYEESLACLVYFDAVTLSIERVSPGLLQLLRVPVDIHVRGKSIVDLLRVSPSTIEAIVSDSKQGISREGSRTLQAEDAHGRQLMVEVTTKYYNESHMVEVAFFVAPLDECEEVEEVEIALKDLDRFRRGMYRRETRILELKEEMNQILKDAGKEPRYKFDQKTQDAHFSTDKFTERRERT